jgi:hypothetical protein
MANLLVGSRSVSGMIVASAVRPACLPPERYLKKVVPFWNTDIGRLNTANVCQNRALAAHSRH